MHPEDEKEFLSDGWCVSFSVIRHTTHTRHAKKSNTHTQMRSCGGEGAKQQSEGVSASLCEMKATIELG